jgi:hypothetical protein
MSQAIPTPEQPEVSAGPRNRWRKRAAGDNRNAEQADDAQAEPAQGLPSPPQLTEAQEIARRIAAESASQGETTFAALSREQKAAVLIAAGELGLSARAFSKGQQNLWPLLNRGKDDPDDKVAALSDSDWFQAYSNRSVRLRLPFHDEIDWSTAAIRGPVAVLTVAVRQDVAGNFHRYPLMMAREAAKIVEKPGGVSESDIEAAVLNASVGLMSLGVKVRDAKVQP